MTIRPRFVRRAWYWRQPREFRRDHDKCCIDTEYCPVCGDPDPDCIDRCGCYERDPDLWRAKTWEQQVKADPSLADIDPPPAAPLTRAAQEETK